MGLSKSLIMPLSWSLIKISLSFLFVFEIPELLFANPETSHIVENKNLHIILSPKIIGKTLLIEGTIDTHIYDFFAWELKTIKESVEIISFNSFGGKQDVAIDIAKKIKELGLSTIVEKGNVCASSCLILFSAGKRRLIHSEVWLGLHGSRLSEKFRDEFEKYCFNSNKNYLANEDEAMVSTLCSSFIKEQYALVLRETNKAFDLMKDNGVDSKLFVWYLSLQKETDWWKKDMNFLALPDVKLSASEAINYNLATEVIN